MLTLPLGDLRGQLCWPSKSSKHSASFETVWKDLESTTYCAWPSCWILGRVFVPPKWCAPLPQVGTSLACRDRRLSTGIEFLISFTNASSFISIPSYDLLGLDIFNKGHWLIFVELIRSMIIHLHMYPIKACSIMCNAISCGAAKIKQHRIFLPDCTLLFIISGTAVLSSVWFILSHTKHVLIEMGCTAARAVMLVLHH